MSITIRRITKEDNPFVLNIIQKVMAEFNADPETTVLADPSIHDMYSNYQEPGAAYFVATDQGTILGGAGIRQLSGSNDPVCELQRMFLLPESRGKGIGKDLMDHCIKEARSSGYKQIYLESLSQMSDAIDLYKRSGFQLIDHPLGATGHGGCNVWMVKDL